jgi:hypothetical protein
MKRSKIFLSMSTFVLAIAALAASKVSSYNVVCYTTGTAHIQHFALKSVNCTLDGLKYFTSLVCARRIYTAS